MQGGVMIFFRTPLGVHY